jgi:hypothetical protein
MVGAWGALGWLCCRGGRPRRAIIVYGVLQPPRPSLRRVVLPLRCLGGLQPTRCRDGVGRILLSQSQDPIGRGDVVARQPLAILRGAPGLGKAVHVGAARFPFGYPAGHAPLGGRCGGVLRRQGRGRPSRRGRGRLLGWLLGAPGWVNGYPPSATDIDALAASQGRATPGGGNWDGVGEGTRRLPCWRPPPEHRCWVGCGARGCGIGQPLVDSAPTGAFLRFPVTVPAVTLRGTGGCPGARAASCYGRSFDAFLAQDCAAERKLHHVRPGVVAVGDDVFTVNGLV